MILNAYTLYDVKALTFNTPFFCQNHAVAKRLCADLVIDMTTSVGRHPADYVLYCLGTYDDNLGVFQNLDIREHVADMMSLLPINATTEA